MNFDNIKKAFSALGWSFDRNALAYMSERTTDFDDLTTSQVIERLKRYDHKPRPVDVINALSSSHQEMKVCQYCKGSGSIGVGKLQVGKSTGIEKWFTVPGSSVKCPECCGNESIKRYIAKAKTIAVWKITLTKPNHPTEVKYPQGDHLDIQEDTQYFQQEGFKVEGAGVVQEIYPLIYERLTWDNKYPLKKWGVYDEQHHPKKKESDEVKELHFENILKEF